MKIVDREVLMQCPNLGYRVLYHPSITWTWKLTCM